MKKLDKKHQELLDLLITYSEWDHNIIKGFCTAKDLDFKAAMATINNYVFMKTDRYLTLYRPHTPKTIVIEMEVVKALRRVEQNIDFSHLDKVMDAPQRPFFDLISNSFRFPCLSENMLESFKDDEDKAKKCPSCGKTDCDSYNLYTKPLWDIESAEEKLLNIIYSRPWHNVVTKHMKADEEEEKKKAKEWDVLNNDATEKYRKFLSFLCTGMLIPVSEVERYCDREKINMRNIIRIINNHPLMSYLQYEAVRFGEHNNCIEISIYSIEILLLEFSSNYSNCRKCYLQACRCEEWKEVEDNRIKHFESPNVVSPLFVGTECTACGSSYCNDVELKCITGKKS